MIVLEDTEEFALNVEVHFPYLIQKECAAIRGVEASDAPCGGARKGALRVTEELALDEIMGDRWAVDRDEGVATALTRAVDSSR